MFEPEFVWALNCMMNGKCMHKEEMISFRNDWLKVINNLIVILHLMHYIREIMYKWLDI